MTKDADNIVNVPMEDIYADVEFNCRGVISPEDVIEMADSIDKQGLLQPVMVRPNANRDIDKKYSLVLGFRRYKAFLILERDTIPCVIKETMTEDAARTLNLTENIHRKNLNILQEAKGIQYYWLMDLGRIQISKKIGMTQGWVQVRMSLLELPDDVHDLCVAGVISQPQIKVIARIWKSGDKEKFYSTVKKIKMARIRGEADPLEEGRKRDIKPNATTHRKRAEIFAMMDHVYSYMEPSIVTRCMAWCAGEISDLDLWGDLREICEGCEGKDNPDSITLEVKGKHYDFPESSLSM